MIATNTRMSRDAAEHDEEPTPEDWEIIRDVAQALELDATNMAPHIFNIPPNPYTRLADALWKLTETTIRLNKLVEQLANRDCQCNP